MVLPNSFKMLCLRRDISHLVLCVFFRYYSCCVDPNLFLECIMGTCLPCGGHHKFPTMLIYNKIMSLNVKKIVLKIG